MGIGILNKNDKSNHWGYLMFNNTLFASEGMIVFLTLLPIVINIILVGFAIYFAIQVIKFMNAKLELDRERNEKLSQLIKDTDHSKDME